MNMLKSTVAAVVEQVFVCLALRVMLYSRQIPQVMPALTSKGRCGQSLKRVCRRIGNFMELRDCERSRWHIVPMPKAKMWTIRICRCLLRSFQKRTERGVRLCMLVGAHEVLMTASGFDLPLNSMEIVCMAVGYRLGHMRGSIFPDSLNVRATGKEVESCALRY